MKKLLFLLSFTLALAFVTEQSHAQLLKTVVPVKDTCVNSDNTTITVTPTSNQVVAFHFRCVKVSGTVGGSAKLQGSIDGTTWTDVGSSYTITDIATNVAVFEPSKLSYTRYRILVTTTGTCKINGIRGYTVQRGN